MRKSLLLVVVMLLLPEFLRGQEFKIPPDV